MCIRDSISAGYIYRTPYGTGHGSPYDYDTHVPLLFSRKNRPKRQVSDHVATVDIAPTIGHILSIPIPDSVDGKILKIE